jgi:hypothetical protein
MTIRLGRLGRAPRLGTVGVLAIVAALSVAACGGGSTPAPSAGASPSPAASPSPVASASPAASPSPSSSPSVSAGPSASGGLIGETGTVEISGVGFRVTMPDGWRAIPLDEDSISRIAELFPGDSQIGQLLQSQAGTLALAGVKLFAIDTRPASIVEGSSPTLNVIVQTKPVGLSVELLGTLAKAQLEALDASSSVVVDTVTLPAGKAVKATYTLEQALADGSSLKASGTQYYLTSDSSLFIVTMTGSASAGDSLTSTFDAMADSIQVD